MPDPAAAEELEIRLVQPYQAYKTYVCPGCNQDIAVGLGHLVVVPRDAPDLRRHWHRAPSPLAPGVLGLPGDPPARPGVSRPRRLPS